MPMNPIWLTSGCRPSPGGTATRARRSRPRSPRTRPRSPSPGSSCAATLMPAVARALGVEADRADAVPERRPVEDRPVDDERGDREEEARCGGPAAAGRPRRSGASRPRRRRSRSGPTTAVSFWSGPPSPNRNGPTQIAIQLSMIVEITSWALRPWLSETPRCRPTPRRRAWRSTIASVMCRNGFNPSNDEPIHTAQMLPTMYWPWPPMLKRPQRNANATARPVRTSVVVTISVCWRLTAANDSKSLTFHGNQTFASLNGSPISLLPTSKNHESPALEDRAVRRDGVLARRHEHHQSADEEREEHVVRSGARIPSARWASRTASISEGSQLRARRPDGSTSGGGRGAAFASLTRLLLVPPAAGHRDAELLLGRRRRELTDDLALVHDEDPVGEREDLLELERDEQDAASLVALLDHAAMHELDRADVEPPRRLRGDQDLGVAVDLAGEDDLLLVPAGEAARARPSARRHGRRTP